MKTITSQLQTFLEGNKQICMADLYTITFANGNVVRWTSADVAVSFDGTTWLVGPPLERGKTHVQLGVQVDSLDVTICPRLTDTIGGTPIGTLLTNGGFDGATLELDRAYFPAWGQPVVGTLIMFIGRIGGIKGDSSKFVVTVQSALELLDTSIPRRLYQPACNRTFYDSGCTVNKAALTVSGAVTSAGQVSFGTNLTQPADYFDRGVLTWETGANAGLILNVQTQSGSGVIALVYAMPAPAAIGDTFSIYPACNKALTGAGGCPTYDANATYVSKIRFGGYPNVPAPETAIGLT